MARSIVIAVLLVSAPIVSADVLVRFDGQTNTMGTVGTIGGANPDLFHVDLMASQLTASPSLASFQTQTQIGMPANVIFAAAGWDVPTSDFTRYYEFTLDAVDGMMLNFTSLDFLENASPAGSGPTTWYARYSLDGFASDLGTGAPPASDILASHNLALNALGHAGPVTFRLIANGAGLFNRAWRVDDIVVNGTVVLIPEPATGALCLLFLALFAGRRPCR